MPPGKGRRGAGQIRKVHSLLPHNSPVRWEVIRILQAQLRDGQRLDKNPGLLDPEFSLQQLPHQLGAHSEKNQACAWGRPP